MTLARGESVTFVERIPDFASVCQGIKVRPTHVRLQYGALPLIEAARTGRLDHAHLLRSFGADPLLRAGWERQNAVETAEAHRKWEVADVLRSHLGLPPSRRPRRWWPWGRG